jgi:hypothetical protein
MGIKLYTLEFNHMFNSVPELLHMTMSILNLSFWQPHNQHFFFFDNGGFLLTRKKVGR